MRSPKQMFIEGGFAKAFGAIADSPAFESACLHALSQLQTEMAPTAVPGNAGTDPYVGLDANSQMFGARRVIEILSSLHRPEEEKEPTKRPTLHYARPSRTPTGQNDS